MKDSSEQSPDPLDRLLGACPLPEPDAWFTARAMARCRLSNRDEAPAFSWGHLWPRWAVSGIFALAITGVGLQQAHRIHTLHLHHQQDRAREAFEVMAKMGKNSDSSWQDSSL